MHSNVLYVLDNQYYDASYNAYGENALRAVSFAEGKSQKVQMATMLYA